MRTYVLFLTLFVSNAFADDFGYIFYAHAKNKVGAVTFEKDDAIVVRTKIKDIKRKGSEFTAIVDFKRMDMGEPKGQWLSGRIDFSQWKRPVPLSQQDPTSWTTEPAHSQPPSEVPREVCP